MKNSFVYSLSLVVSVLVLSCQKEQQPQPFTEVTIELRSTNWCDGGGTNPPAVYIADPQPYVDPLTGHCCVTFRFQSAFTGKTVKLTTTDYNFKTMTGNSGNNNSYFFNSGTGTVTYCFPQQGSHFLIEILDGNGNTIACNDFENQCE
jgi:hypothetical protein